MGLLFSAACDDASLIEVLETRRDEHQTKLDELRAHAAALAGESAEAMSARVTVLRQTALEGAMTHHRATIDWLDECIDAVRDGPFPDLRQEQARDTCSRRKSTLQ